MMQYFIDNDIGNYDFESNIENDEKKAIQNVDIFVEFMRDYVIKQLKSDESLEEIETHGLALLTECKKYYSARNYEMKFNENSIIKNINVKFPNVMNEKRTSKSRLKIIDVNLILEQLEITREDCIEFELEF
jgi:hypothetical protein